jgi:hypothetical protein
VRPSSEKLGWVIDILTRNTEALSKLHANAPSTMQASVKEVKQGVDGSILMLKEIIEQKKRRREKELEK